VADIPLVVLSAFDPSTRMLPFLFDDRRMVPIGARLIAGAVHQAGFHRSRSVFQLWNPNFRPSRARIDGRLLQMLLVSSMQLHSQRAAMAIRDAWTMGDERPLIIVGGPKAIYEPYHFWSIPEPGPRVAPDVAVTGEAYVLLDLLNVIRQHRGRGVRARWRRCPGRSTWRLGRTCVNPWWSTPACSAWCRTWTNCLTKPSDSACWSRHTGGPASPLARCPMRRCASSS
jgi:hypothetical protein